MPRRSAAILALAALLGCSSVGAFAPPRPHHRGLRRAHDMPSLRSRAGSDDGDCAGSDAPTAQRLPSRRDVLRRTAAASAAIAGGMAASSSPASALPPIASFSSPFATSATKSNGGIYVPAKRCTAYLVDSTIPPSLIPYRASREAAILKGIGMGGGTPKSPFVEDDVNLNNFMNKAVFGTIDAVKKVTGQDSGGIGKSGPNYQSFVFLGANFDDTYTASPEKNGGDENADAALAVGLLTDICKPRERNGNTAIGLAFAPQSAQGALDAYLEGGAEGDLLEGLVAAGADGDLASKHLPILQFARRKRCALLALAPERGDLDTVRKGGLQSLDPERREAYVADAQGFIALTQDPKFKLYADKSLLKDFAPSPSAASDESASKAEQGNFFAERILVHEAAATAASRWASARPESLVVTVAPIPDVRFLGGMNGRVPRVCKHLNPDTLVDDEAVTTILLNPSARETLSESKFLRLEIGTAPNNWTYQTKVADYLWFSSMPKVNMIPRMMNEQ